MIRPLDHSSFIKHPHMTNATSSQLNKKRRRFYLEGLHERIEIGDGEADVVATGKVLGVDGGGAGAVRALGEPGLRQPLDEVEEEARGGQAQPYHLELEVGALHLLEPKNLQPSRNPIKTQKKK